MLKKEYIQPSVEVIETKVQQHLLAGSGPGAGDQHNPGMGAPSLSPFEDELDLESDLY